MTETPPTRLVARGPEDLLAMVPIVIGFAPTDSVVMLTFEAAHAFHARIDLPERTDPVRDVVDALLTPARRHRVGRVAFVFYAAEPEPVRPTWRALRSACAEHGIAVVEALRTDGERWYPLLGGDRRLRELGVAYDVSAHPFAAQAVLSGRVTHPSRAALAAQLHPDPRRTAAVDAALAATVVEPPVDPARAEALVRTHLAAVTVPEDAQAARLLRALVHDEARVAVSRSLDRSSARAHVDLWLGLLRRTPSPYVPGVASLLALAAWQAGDGALAWCAVDRCVEVDPGHPLAAYVASALTHAVPPSAHPMAPGDQPVR